MNNPQVDHRQLLDLQLLTTMRTLPTGIDSEYGMGRCEVDCCRRPGTLLSPTARLHRRIDAGHGRNPRLYSQTFQQKCDTSLSQSHLAIKRRMDRARDKLLDCEAMK